MLILSCQRSGTKAGVVTEITESGKNHKYSLCNKCLISNKIDEATSVSILIWGLITQWWKEVDVQSNLWINKMENHIIMIKVKKQNQE